MACGSCSSRNNSRQTNGPLKREYNLTGGLDIRSLNIQQIQARLEVFKRKYCFNCSTRYQCNYLNYLECKKNN